MVFLTRYIFLLVFLLFSTACSNILTPSVQQTVQEKYIEANVSVSKLDKYSKILSREDVRILNHQINEDAKACESLVLKDTILYTKIYFFNAHVTECFKKINKSKGVIIDLRGNPGGVLEGAISLVDMYLNNGVILKEKSRKSEYVYYAKKDNTYLDIPLVILVDKNTASASEIVAGSLQKHHRAIIIGTSTYGKGTIQEIIPLRNQKVLKLTVARYYLPGNINIEGRGITPDIQLVSKYPYLKIKDKRFEFLRLYKYSKRVDIALLLAVQTIHYLMQ